MIRGNSMSPMVRNVGSPAIAVGHLDAAVERGTLVEKAR